MTNQSFNAWLIHKQWSGDTSARIILFTKEFGFISCLYKGGRMPKKQALLQPFVSLWVNLTERHDSYYVHSLEQDAPELSLSGTSLFSALYLNELLYYVLKPGSAEPELFSAYTETLHALTDASYKEVIEVVLRRFEWTVLYVCGHHFSLTHEADNHRAIEACCLYQLIPGRGLKRADQGIPGSHILALAADDWTNDEHLKSAKYMMRRAIDYVLQGRIIKARSLFLK